MEWPIRCCERGGSVRKSFWLATLSWGLCSAFAVLPNPVAAAPIQPFDQYREQQKEPPSAELKELLVAGAYQGALQQQVDRARAYLDAGNTLFAIHELQGAVHDFPEAPGIHTSLGRLYNLTGRYAAAADLAERMLKAFPEGSEGYEILGTAELGQGRVGEAVAAYRKWVARDPESPAAHQLLAAALIRGDDPEGALEEFERALALDPHLSEAAIQSAVLLGQLGRPEQAAGRAESLLAENSEDAFALFILADAHAARGDRAAAVDGYRRAVALQPGFAHFSVRLAEFHAEEEEWEAAIAVLDALSERAALGPEVHQRLAELHFRSEDPARRAIHLGAAARARGELDAAAEHYRSAKKLDPGSRDAALGLAVTELRRGHASAAGPLIAELLVASPEDPLALTLQGRVLLLQGKRPAAEECFRQALQAVPGFPDAQRALAALLFETRRFAEAAPVYEAVSESSPAAPGPYERIGDCQLALNQPGKAERAYLKALERRPGDPNLQGKLARLYLQAGRNPGLTLSLATQAAALRPAEAATQFTLGRAQLAVRDYAAARQSLEAALALRPDEPAVLIALGVARYEVGAVAEARAALEQALSLSPEPTSARRAQRLLEQIKAAETP